MYRSNTINDPECYQLTAQVNSTCFATWWAAYSYEYKSYSNGVCPPKYNYLEQSGVPV